MPYQYSKIDRDNLSWFTKDNRHRSLLEIKLTTGRLRGLDKFEVDLKYPISVFAGKNGSGKSTILALAACAYHNKPDGFKLTDRKTTYYTFSDFFIQSSDEVRPEGVRILYGILHNNWRKSNMFPEGKGLGYQLREKKKSGKWNTYSGRVSRNTLYFGVNRVVPPSEKSVAKSYRGRFKAVAKQGFEDDVRKVIGKILNRNYLDFWFINHRKYRIPIARTSAGVYSGYNMGAGENTLFEIFTSIYRCPEGSMVIIDEIELGLHEEAQKRFIESLKEICLSRKIQIICTTHSFTILKSVPPEARFFVESFKDKTIITPGISAYFAAGKLAGENSNELDIFVEDEVARSLLEMTLPNDIRKRVNIIEIGSHSAVIKQLGARYKNLKKGKAIAILDGDQKKGWKNHKNNFIGFLELSKEEDKDKADEWLREMIQFLPGEVWPEKWIIESLQNSSLENLAIKFGLSEHELIDFLIDAINSGKHNEFYTLSKNLNLDQSLVRSYCCEYLNEVSKNDFQYLIDFLQVKLDE